MPSYRNGRQFLRRVLLRDSGSCFLKLNTP